MPAHLHPRRAPALAPDGGMSGGVLYALIVLLSIALKLSGVARWSWWWALSPIWMLVVAIVLAGSAWGVVGAFGGGRREELR